jgi:REP element-mobilizing transposase RayT
MRTSKAEIYLHFVWGTIQRLPLVTERIERPVYRCIQEEAMSLGCDILALGGIADHVHLVLKIPPRRSPAEIMKQVKGVSSLFVNKILSGHEGFRWQEGYGVFSISPAHVQKVIAYVENQKQHHAEGTILARWEETDTEYIPKE